MEYTLQEERMAKVQVEEKLLQLKKDHSMLDCDYKLVQNKLEELQAQKEQLSEEVPPPFSSFPFLHLLPHPSVRPLAAPTSDRP